MAGSPQALLQIYQSLRLLYVAYYIVRFPACQYFFKNFLNFLLSLFSLLLIFRCTYVHLKEKQGGTHNSNMILKNLLSSSSLTQFNIVTHIIYSVFAAVNIFLNNF